MKTWKSFEEWLSTHDHPFKMPPSVPRMPVVEGTLWFGKVRLGPISVQRAYVRFGGYVLTMDFGTS